jgi:hypothetical protein
MDVCRRCRPRHRQAARPGRGPGHGLCRLPEQCPRDHRHEVHIALIPRPERFHPWSEHAVRRQAPRSPRLPGAPAAPPGPPAARSLRPPPAAPSLPPASVHAGLGARCAVHGGVESPHTVTRPPRAMAVLSVYDQRRPQAREIPISGRAEAVTSSSARKQECAILSIAQSSLTAEPAGGLAHSRGIAALAETAASAPAVGRRGLLLRSSRAPADRPSAAGQDQGTTPRLATTRPLHPPWTRPR